MVPKKELITDDNVLALIKLLSLFLMLSLMIDLESLCEKERAAILWSKSQAVVEKMISEAKQALIFARSVLYGMLKRAALFNILVER